MTGSNGSTRTLGLALTEAPPTVQFQNTALTRDDVGDHAGRTDAAHAAPDDALAAFARARLARMRTSSGSSLLFAQVPTAMESSRSILSANPRPGRCQRCSIFEMVVKLQPKNRPASASV